MRFREFAKNKEIEDFYNNIKEIEDFHLREYNRNYYKNLSLIPINEGIILPENIKIKSDLKDVDSLNKEFEKEGVIFHYKGNISKNKMNAHYKQEKDEIHIFYGDNNTENEIEALIGHKMIHRQQHKKSNGNYFKRAKELTAELNKIADEFNKTNDIKLFSEYKKKIKFKDFDNHFEQTAYVYQTIKENPNLNPPELLQLFKKWDFDINYRLKKYIGMYWLIRDII